MAGGAAMNLAMTPITTIIAKEGGVFQSVLATVAQAVPGLDNVQTDRIIPALSAFYIFATYMASSAASVGGQAAGNEKGRDINRESLTAYTMTKICADSFEISRPS